jgi:dTDP-4-amino-4,6-dideoxygalactose transaminase
MTRRFLPFGAPAIGREEIEAVVRTLESGWIGTGPTTQEFERAFAAYVGCDHAVAVSSCTAALHLALVASKIGPGDEVITTPMTFAATANAICHAGATPVFVDIDRETLNLDPSKIEAAITPRTKALIPVHFGGRPCDMDRINAIARSLGLLVVEDAAHAIGARYRGRPVGNLGNLTCFSFYANKNITTGEGGMITFGGDQHSAALAQALRVWRLHGLSTDAWKRYQEGGLVLSEAMCAGFKYNMTDIQAALGLCQLRKLDQFLAVRERYAHIYDEAFSSLEEIAVVPRPASGQDRHGLHLYVLLLNLEKVTASRDEVVGRLQAEKVGAAIHYKALHLHPFYRDLLKYPAGRFPNAEFVSQRVFSLPLTPAMALDDVEYVVGAVQRVLSAVSRRVAV